MGLNVGKMLACEPKIFWGRPLAGADFMLKTGVLRQFTGAEERFWDVQTILSEFCPFFEVFTGFHPGSFCSRDYSGVGGHRVAAKAA